MPRRNDGRSEANAPRDMFAGLMAAVVVAVNAAAGSFPSVEVEARLSISFSLAGEVVVIRRRDVYAVLKKNESKKDATIMEDVR